MDRGEPHRGSAFHHGFILQQELNPPIAQVADPVEEDDRPLLLEIHGVDSWLVGFHSFDRHSTRVVQGSDRFDPDSHQLPLGLDRGACFDDRMDWDPIVEAALLTAGYWLVDLAGRRQGLAHTASRVGISSAAGQALVVLVPAVAGAAFLGGWSSIPEGFALQCLTAPIAALLAWKATTKDIDAALGNRETASRLLLVLSAVGTVASPWLLLPTMFLLTRPFGLWEHHSTLPMRVLQAVSAWLLLHAGVAAIGQDTLFADTTILVWMVSIIVLSHYLITAIAKIWLGPKWYSWVVDNRVHHLAASAYSWGWAKFMPWHVWRKVILASKATERPAQAFAFGVELLAPLALLDRNLAIAFCVAWAAFHTGVFALSGLLFWDWIAADLAVAAMLWFLPEHVADEAFGLIPFAAGTVFLIVFPLRHKLWKPIPLGWWDTPFTQRIHWHAHGESGRVYGLYNDFMCPNERLYGKVHACFFALDRGITYHLGEVWKRDLRDAIRAAGPDLDRLQTVRDQYGIDMKDDRLASNHIAYLQRFFAAVNEGHAKRVLPSWLRWLKAPGDQIFYWGDLPRFDAQERVVKVSLHYREEYFDGDKLVRLRDSHVLDVTVPDKPPEAICCPEPTPREIDDMLLARANGKIIDLPDFGSGYVDVDDGKPGAVETAGSR